MQRTRMRLERLFDLRRFGATALLAAVVIAAVIVIPALGGNDQNPLAGATGGRGFEDTVAKALPSVVQIKTDLGLGSGIVFDGNGHIVTNAHVVKGAHSFQVTAADGSTHPATLSGVYAQGDLAVVHVQGVRLPPATFADSSQVRVGEIALAIGNPLGLRSSVTQGIISSTSRDISESASVSLTSLIQTSAEINPGNSGGALVNQSGAVIGVPTLAALDPEMQGTPAPGIGFAIASNTVRSVAGQLASGGTVQTTPTALTPGG
jgi:putative serine protease PepD